MIIALLTAKALNLLTRRSLKRLQAATQSNL